MTRLDELHEDRTPRHPPYGVPARRDPAPRIPLGGAPVPRTAAACDAPRDAEEHGSRAGVSEHGERICRLAASSAAADDAESSLRMLTELRRELDAFMQLQVRRSLAAGCSFGEVARALGISRQAAHRRYRELAPAPGPSRVVATEELRGIVRLAHAETVATGGTRAAGSRELLLALLQTDSEAARALRSQGVTLEKARSCARAAGFGTNDPSALRRILQRARRAALSGGDNHVRPEHVLLAAIADRDGAAGRTLKELGATPAAIRARLSR